MDRSLYQGRVVGRNLTCSVVISQVDGNSVIGPGSECVLPSHGSSEVAPIVLSIIAAVDISFSDISSDAILEDSGSACPSRRDIAVEVATVGMTSVKHPNSLFETLHL